MPSEPTRKPVDQNAADATIARRGPPVSTQVPNTRRADPEHDDGDREDDPDRRQRGVEVLDERGLVDAGRVGLADAEMDGEGGGRDEPPVVAGTGDGALAIENGQGHGGPPERRDPR